jgi:uncharacterized protein (TIGR00255 family)
MTGYARARQAFDGGEVTLTLKSVNHRSLDLHFHLPDEIDALEPAMRGAMRERLTRGHVDIRASVTRSDATGEAGLNVPLFHAYLGALKQSAAALGIAEAKPDLHALLRVPGMVQLPEAAEADAALESRILGVLNEALDSLDAFRTREGKLIAEVILRHLKAIGQHAKEMDSIRGRAVPALQARIGERLRELLRGVSIDPQRLAQEAAFLADRGDVGEEIERLKIHAGHMDELLKKGGEVGKRLDFLLQEMNREANTILSKTNGIGELGLRITELALEAKADIEKIREHALNLE